MEVDGVKMRFKAVNDTNTPDINTIYVGDEFFMYIKYKGCKCQKILSKSLSYTASLDRKSFIVRYHGKEMSKIWTSLLTTGINIKYNII